MNVSLIELLTQAGSSGTEVNGAQAGSPAPGASSEVFSALLQEYKALYTEDGPGQAPAAEGEPVNAAVPTEGDVPAPSGVDAAEVVAAPSSDGAPVTPEADVESGTEAQQVTASVEAGKLPPEHSDTAVGVSPLVIANAPSAGDSPIVVLGSESGVVAQANSLPTPKTTTTVSVQSVAQRPSVQPQAIGLVGQAPVDSPVLNGLGHPQPKPAVAVGSQSSLVVATTPAQPAQPAIPVVPATSATAAEPATPASPGTPVATATPATPGTPVATATPATPATPALPATPATPAAVAPTVAGTSSSAPSTTPVIATPVAAITPANSSPSGSETAGLPPTPLASGEIIPKVSSTNVGPPALQSGGAIPIAVSGVNTIPDSHSNSERTAPPPALGSAVQPKGENAPATPASVAPPGELAAQPASAVQGSVSVSQSIRSLAPRVRGDGTVASLAEASTVAIDGEATGDADGAVSIPRQPTPGLSRAVPLMRSSDAASTAPSVSGSVNESMPRPFLAEAPDTVASDAKPKVATLASTSRAALLQSSANAIEVPLEAKGAPVTPASSIVEASPVTTTARVETMPGLASLTAPTAPAESSVEAPASMRPTLQTLGDFAVKSVRYINTQGGETITVRLVPESLGELRVVVKSGSDGLEIELSSRNQVVRETLDRQLPALQEAFARDGTDVARITVSAPSAFDADGSAGRPSQQSGSQAPSSGSGQGRGNSPSSNTYGTDERPRTTAPPHDGALNVFA